MRLRRKTNQYRTEEVPTTTNSISCDNKEANITKSPDRNSDKRLKFLKSLYAVVLSSMVLGIYTYTAYPSVAGGDSGELLAESCHLGVSHPPGYPLYNMLLHVIMNIPGGKNKAWKANLFASVCDTLTSIMIFLSITLWTNATRSGKYLAAFTASSLFAFSPLIWTYAIGAEVFSLNNLFVSVILYICLYYSKKDSSWKLVYIGSFFCGLAMCNQHTIILLEIPIICFVLWTKRKSLEFMKCLKVILLFFAGLLPYIYIPLTSYFNPQPGSWGHVTTLSGFFHHLRRGDYGSFRLYSTEKLSEDITTRLEYYFKDLIIREGLYIILPVGILGILVSLSLHHNESLRASKTVIQDNNSIITKRSSSGSQQSKNNTKFESSYWKLISPVSCAIVLAYAFYLVVFHALSNLPLEQGLLYGVHMRFWQQPNIIVFIWFGIGLSKCYEWIQNCFKPFPHIIQLSVLHVIAGLIISMQIQKWIGITNQHNGWYIENYARALIDELPQNSLYLTNYDLQWTSIRYLQRCEGFRKDITFINLSMMTYHWFKYKHQHYPNLRFPGTHLVPVGSMNGGFTIKQFVDANYKNFKKSGIYLGGKLSYQDDDFLLAYKSIPHGLLTRFYKKSTKLTLKKWYKRNKAAMMIVNKHLPQLPTNKTYDDLTWEWTIARDYQMQKVEHATHLLDVLVSSSNTNLTLLVEAAKPLEYSLKYEPTSFYSDNLLKNLGLAYAYMVKSNEDFSEYPIEEPFESYIASHIQKNRYKDRASYRMLEVWRLWIKKNKAQEDPSYNTIKGIVDKFSKS